MHPLRMPLCAVASAKVQKVLDQTGKKLCEREFMIMMNSLPQGVSDTKNQPKMEAFRAAQKSLDAAMQKAVSCSHYLAQRSSYSSSGIGRGRRVETTELPHSVEGGGGRGIITFCCA